jgi:hypothetical protein
MQRYWLNLGALELHAHFGEGLVGIREPGRMDSLTGDEFCSYRNSVSVSVIQAGHSSLDRVKSAAGAFIAHDDVIMDA